MASSVFNNFLYFATIITLIKVRVISSQNTPVPILKQINKQNGDGSYSYGYENADGSYKIETKYPSGEVAGKYGYVDDTGNLREIEYGASRRGFEPVGTGITVPPPVIHDNKVGNGLETDYDDGQYREDPSIYYQTESPVALKYPSQFANSKNSLAPQTIRRPTPPVQFENLAVPVAPQYTNLKTSVGNTYPSQNLPTTNYDPYAGSSYTITYTG